MTKFHIATNITKDIEDYFCLVPKEKAEDIARKLAEVLYPEYMPYAGSSLRFWKVCMICGRFNDDTHWVNVKGTEMRVCPKCEAKSVLAEDPQICTGWALFCDTKGVLRATAKITGASRVDMIAKFGRFVASKGYANSYCGDWGTRPFYGPCAWEKKTGEIVYLSDKEPAKNATGKLLSQATAK